MRWKRTKYFQLVDGCLTLFISKLSVNLYFPFWQIRPRNRTFGLYIKSGLGFSYPNDWEWIWAFWFLFLGFGIGIGYNHCDNPKYVNPENKER